MHILKPDGVSVKELWERLRVAEEALVKVRRVISAALGGWGGTPTDWRRRIQEIDIALKRIKGEG